MKKIIFVIGGAGYIGSHVCKLLFKNGFLPITLDNLVNGNSWAVKWGPLEIVDILDKTKLEYLINKYKPYAVMHFASYAYVGESVLDPGKYYRNNFCGTLNLLETMKENNINKIIFSSSCATFGIPNKLPIREDDTQNPINPYGKSKLMIENLLEDYDTAHSIKSVTLRYFNAAGADEEVELGELHEPETHLIPLLFDVAAGVKNKIKVFGGNYDTKDGTCIRDYVHVTDLAYAHLSALKRLEKSADSEKFNLGTGVGYSVKEVIFAVEKITQKKIVTEIVEKRPGDPPSLIACKEKAYYKLGWKPRENNLESIIKTGWAWYNKITKGL